MKRLKAITTFFNSFSLLSRVIVCGALIFSVLSLSGCAFLQFGGANVTPFEIIPPMGVDGLTKSQVVARFGPPASTIVDEKGFEHWVYPLESYFYILLYGQGQRMNLILKFRDDKVIANRLIETGSTINFLIQER